ncbi:MAG: alpha/beta hydrolase, partial [bacterium]|nr:alpha/beta hydrolase [bacterium]
DIRLSRLNEKERTEVQTLMKLFGAPSEGDENKIMARLGQLMDRADSYDPLPDENWNQEIRSDIYQGVWPIAAELRRSGKLLEMGNKIQCPVTAIHGDYDPHMYKGVEEPLSRILTDFHFYLLDRCGHSPWQERQAHKRFYEILKREITDVFPGVG